VFVLYGSSTKRSDNVQTGGFGIGAKSAWAYTDSFIIQSYFDGKCRTYIAHTGKNSNGSLELIEEVDSNEPNGVEIQVPVKESDISQFVSAVYRCTYFWDVKPELKGVTNLETPASWLDVKKKVFHKKDGWFLLEKDEFIKHLFDAYNHEIYVLIDKIPYSINKFSRFPECPEVDRLKNLAYANFVNFIEVDNGVLEVSATRESISDKDNSKVSVNQICKTAKDSLCKYVDEQFAQDFKDIPHYTNFYFKLKATLNLSSIGKNLDFSFKKNGFSYKFVDGKITSKDLDGCLIERYNIKRQKSRSVLNRSTNIGIAFGEEKSIYVLINNERPDRPVPEYLFKEKIKKLFTDEDLKFVYTINHYTETQRDNFKDHFDAIYLSDIKIEKNTSAANYKTKRASGTISIRYVKNNTYGYNRARLESDTKEDTTLEDIENSKEKYISIPFSSAELYDFDNPLFVENVNFLINYGKYKVIKLSKRDYDAVNTLDNVFEYTDVVSEIPEYVEIENSVIENYVFRQSTSYLEALRPFINRIDCPKIAEYFAIKSNIPNNNRAVGHAVPDRILALYPYFNKVSANTKKLAELEAEISRKYPLMRQISHIIGGYYSPDADRNLNISEFIFYLNAKNEKVN
jgi:hypothetical protein